MLKKSWVLTSLVLSLSPVNAQDFWQQTNGPYRPYRQPTWCFSINSNGDLFAGIVDPNNNGGVFRSTDNGAHWSQTGLKSYSVYALAISSSGVIYAGVTLYRNIFGGGNTGGLFRSTDNGAHWSQTSLPHPYVRTLAINSNGHIFAGTDSSGVFHSTDNGANWTAVNTGLTNTYVLSLALNSSGDLFAGTFGGGAFRSTDNGASWTAVNAGLTATYVWSLAVNSSGDLFAGTLGGGAFRSTDNGSSWTAVNTGLTNTDVRSLAVNSSGYVFAGTSGGGVFRSVQITTAVGDGPGAIPKSYSLSQNYPNPFNPATTIRYFLPKRGTVTLEIFNLAGQRVKVLAEEEQSAGEHILTWDGMDEKGSVLPSGLYFYRLKGKDFSETKKMIFLK